MKIDERLHDTVKALESLLERRATELCDEVAHYPTPIGRCDVTLTKLIEQRDHYLGQLRAIRGVALPSDAAGALIARGAWPEDEEEQALVAQLGTAALAEEKRSVG